MFDLIGYWSAVTIYSLWLLAPLVLILYLLGDPIINIITSGDHPDIIHDYRACTLGIEDFTFHLIIWMSGITGACFILVISVDYLSKGVPPYQVLSDMALSSTATFSWVIYSITGTVVFIKVSQYLYKLSKVVHTLKKKVDKMGN